MKLFSTMTLAKFFAIALTGISFTSYALDFDGEEYMEAFREQVGEASIIEFLPEGQTLESWKTMVTVQCHPGAGSLRNVIGPYFDARRQIVALAPELIENESEYADDTNLIMFLGGPNVGKFEFVLGRWILRETDVIGVIYSRDFPVNENIDVSVAMNNKARWIDELSKLSFELLSSSCAKGSQENDA